LTLNSVAEPHHVDAALTRGRKIDMAPAPTPFFYVDLAPAPAREMMRSLRLRLRNTGYEIVFKDRKIAYSLAFTHSTPDRMRIFS
jgi:hypothetical protein